MTLSRGKSQIQKNIQISYNSNDDNFEIKYGTFPGHSMLVLNFRNWSYTSLGNFQYDFDVITIITSNILLKNRKKSQCRYVFSRTKNKIFE